MVVTSTVHVWSYVDHVCSCMDHVWSNMDHILSLSHRRSYCRLDSHTKHKRKKNIPEKPINYEFIIEKSKFKITQYEPTCAVQATSEQRIWSTKSNLHQTQKPSGRIAEKHLDHTKKLPQCATNQNLEKPTGRVLSHADWSKSRSVRPNSLEYELGSETHKLGYWKIPENNRLALAFDLALHRSALSKQPNAAKGSYLPSQERLGAPSPTLVPVAPPSMLVDALKQPLRPGMDRNPSASWTSKKWKGKSSVCLNKCSISCAPKPILKLSKTVHTGLYSMSLHDYKASPRKGK